MLDISITGTPLRYVSDEISGSVFSESANEVTNRSPINNDKIINKIKEKFQLPIYNLIIAMATSSIAEDWKSLHALNNVFSVSDCHYM